MRLVRLIRCTASVGAIPRCTRIITLALTGWLLPALNLNAAEPVLLMADESLNYQAFGYNLQSTVTGAAPTTLADWLISWWMPESTSPSNALKLTLEDQQSTLALLNPSDSTVDPMTAAEPPFPALCRQAGVVIAIGPDSATAAAQGNCLKPTVFALLPRYRVEPLLRDARERPLTAVYLEADPRLNLQLIRNAIPTATTVGVLVAPSQQSLLPVLRTEASRLGLTLADLSANDESTALRLLRTRIDRFDALLLLPETQVVNDWSLKPILLMSARHRVPVFGGLSLSYVKAGVTAAVLPDMPALQQQIKQAADAIAVGHPSSPSYPKRTQVVVNTRMVRSLALHPEDFTLRPDHE